MYLKGSKQDVLSRINGKVLGHTNLYFDQYNTTASTVKSKIEEMVRSSISAAFSELLDNIYTDVEFEQDIGLTPK